MLSGGLTACRKNPYTLTPAEQRRAVATINALGGGSAGDGCLTGDPRWRPILANLERPAQPNLLPPFMQYWFAAAVKLGGPTLFSLRASYLIAEMVLLGALCLLLGRLGASPLQLAAVGWAPLVFKELINAAHYEMVPMMLLTLAALLLVSQRHVASAALLGLACGSDFLVLLLAPLWIRATPSGRRLAVGGVMALTLALLWAPFASSAATVLDAVVEAGLHPAVSSPVFAGLSGLLVKVGVPARSAVQAGLGVVGSLAVLAVLAYPLGQGSREHGALRAALVVLAMAVIAGPSASPWRLCWLLPLVALEARPAWLVLVGLLPILYFEPYLGRQGLAAYRIWIVSAPFVVFAVLAAANLIYRNKSSSRGRIRSAARA